MYDKRGTPLLPLLQNHDSCRHPVLVPPPRSTNSGPHPRTHCFLIAGPTCLSSDHHVPAAITSRDDRFVFKYLVSLHEYREGFGAGLERQWGEQIDTEWTPPSVMCARARSLCVIKTHLLSTQQSSQTARDWMAIGASLMWQVLLGKWSHGGRGH